MSTKLDKDRGGEAAPVFSWDAPEVFLALGLKQQEAALLALEDEAREPWLRLLEADPRKGRRDLARRLRRRRDKDQALERRWRELSEFDRRHAGGVRLAGVDEVGRGPLAGPVTAAAVILPEGWRAPGLDDSKRLSAHRREHWAERIRQDALAFEIRDLSAAEVDRMGIRHAVLRAMCEAVAGLEPAPERVLVDGRETPPGLAGALAVVGGDARSLSVAASSVLAKVHRDAIMAEMAGRHPGYGFEGHKGYGSAGHIEAIRRLGPCPIHRRSFLGRILAEEPESPGP